MWKKRTISLLTLLIYTCLTPLSLATEITVKDSFKNPSNTLLAQRGRGGRGGRSGRSGGRSRGNRGSNRSSFGASGSNRINRSNRSSRPQRSINRDNVNFNRDRNRSNRIERPNNRYNRGNRVERPNNRYNRGNRIERPGNRPNLNNGINNRDINLNNDRNFSNRVNRNRANIGNRVNIGNRNVVVNPRVRPAWGWNRGVAWYPRYNYWGGGFWGAFAIGTVTGAVLGSAANSSSDTTYVENNYYVVEQGTPGYTLLEDYGLTQVDCTDRELVIIEGPEESMICANPNQVVPAGTYEVDTSTLTLVVAE